MARIAPMLVPAEGFLELGLHQDAWEELEKLPPAARAHPDVLLMRMDILLALDAPTHQERFRPSASDRTR